jgi:LmbE family N-acetylglucosaminyl deacetylase
MAVVLDDAEIARVLCITAHPDDVDFAVAGTVARWTEAGLEVIYCVVTDGDAGGFDEAFPRDEMPALRRGEQVAAAKCVGVQDVRFLGYRDGRVEASLDAAPGPGPGDQAGPPGPGGDAPARSGGTTGSGSATRTTARSAPPRWTPSTPTRVTRSRSPSCATMKAWPPGPSARSGSPAARRTTTWT